MTEHPQSPSPETILAHEPFIRALARRLVGDPGGADDVTQETLIAAWRGGPVERLRSWMAQKQPKPQFGKVSNVTLLHVV